MCLYERGGDRLSGVTVSHEATFKTTLQSASMDPTRGSRKWAYGIDVLDVHPQELGESVSWVRESMRLVELPQRL
jgi:hypothetical protein